MGYRSILRSQTPPRRPAPRNPIAAENTPSVQPDSAPWGTQELLATANWPTSGAIQCDQAVFTSLRSATAEGYRIVGSSLGVRQEEKLDLTRRSPSHGGLCADHDAAMGIIAYPLPTGRYCVGCCRLAGAEHTARGGQRVHTHAVLLSEEEFKRFEFNAVRAASSLLRATQELVLSEQPVMDQLTMLEPTAEHVCATPPGNISSELVRHLVICMLDSTQRICAHGTQPLAAVELALAALPVARRAEVSFSVGVTYSPARRLHLALIDGDVTETKRIIRGQPVECFSAAELPGLALPEYDEWLTFVEDSLSRRSAAIIRKFTNRLPHACGAEALNRIARLQADMERSHTYDEAERAELFATYSCFDPKNELERELADRIRLYTQPPEDPQ